MFFSCLVCVYASSVLVSTPSERDVIKNYNAPLRSYYSDGVGSWESCGSFFARTPIFPLRAFRSSAIYR